MNSPPQTLRRPRRALPIGPAWLAAIAALVIALAIFVGAEVTGPAVTHHAAAHHATLVAEAPDPLARESYPDPAGARTHARASAPSVAAATASPGAPSLSTVQHELAQLHQYERTASSGKRLGGYIDPTTGAFSAANVVPLAIAQVIAGGNAIADFPYVYGGGHASFVDRAYDCSGSVSYALAAAGLIAAPETSGQLEHWGVPGPGRYLTVFATAGHTFMYVDGVWFDTAGRTGPYSTRWLRPQPPLAGYVERHYPGL
jgi:cell wall-associated NlpC family hydrolase